MPKLISDEAAGGMTGNLATNFTFQATAINNLGATEYTLATIAVDTTGSVSGFENELRDMLVTAVKACQASPQKENLLVRVILFSTSYGKGGYQELHGFVPVLGINTDDYPAINPSGATPLWDATYHGIGAMLEYSESLTDHDYTNNGILFVITDGMEGDAWGGQVSTATPEMIAEEFRKAVSEERFESLVSVLIGINAKQNACLTALENFKRDANFTQYTDAGTATSSNLAKLARFVSQSISSQSQALGTGGPSQSIAATI